MIKEFFENMLGRMKIFWMTFLLVFVFASLQLLGMRAPSLLPLISTKMQSIFSPTSPSHSRSVQTRASVNTIKKGGE